MKITIVIPTVYDNGCSQAKECVSYLEKSLKEANDNNFQVELVLYINNFSLKNEAKNLKKIEQEFTNKKEYNLNILTSNINQGYTGAVNQSIEYALNLSQSDWFLVINDDALVDLSFFKEIKSYLQKKNYNKEEYTGIVSCGVRKPSQKVESVGLDYLRSGLTKENKKIKSKNDYFCGTCFFISGKTVLKLIKDDGYILQPMFLAYAEDIELSIRLMKMGQNILIVPKILVTHLGSKTAKRASFFQLFHGYRNLLWIIILHWPGRKIVKNIVYIIFGQIYCFGLSVYKGYWKLYPKIIKETYLNMDTLLYLRSYYEKK